MISDKKLMGHNLEVNKYGEYSLPAEKHEAIMDELGATKDVRDKVRKARSQIYNEGLKILAEDLCNENDKGTKVFRTKDGDSCTCVAVTGMEYPEDRADGTTDIRYGDSGVAHCKHFVDLLDDDNIQKVEHKCKEYFSEGSNES